MTNPHTARNGYRRSPTAVALVSAVEREIDHLTLAASRGMLDDLKPLAIPHGPLLANLHALHESLRPRNTPASLERSRQPVAVFTPITVDLAITAALPPQYSADERIARALMRRAANAATGPTVPSWSSVTRLDHSITRVDGCGDPPTQALRARVRPAVARTNEQTNEPVGDPSDRGTES